MFTNAFVGQSRQPTLAELAAALGKAVPLWQKLLALLEPVAPGLEWNSYSKKAGWSLKVKKGDRTILYLAPGQGKFRTSFALGDKAVKAALRSNLSPQTIEIIRSAKRYAEGTAVRIEVNTAEDLQDIKTLIAIKIEN